MIYDKLEPFILSYLNNADNNWGKRNLRNLPLDDLSTFIKWHIQLVIEAVS